MGYSNKWAETLDESN